MKGIEPSQPDWKSGTLPLSYTRVYGPPRAAVGHGAYRGARSDLSFNVSGPPASLGEGCWWAKQDSNLRRQSHQIYSLTQLTALVFARATLTRLSPTACRRANKQARRIWS